jgi:cell division septal protein FtsQ
VVSIKKKFFVTSEEGGDPWERERRLRRRFWRVLLIIFIPAFLYFFFASPVFAVKDLIVDGVVTSEMQATFETLKGKNIFLVRVSRLTIALPKDNPEIKKIEIFRGLPDAIKIKVEKRTGEIKWESGGKIYLIDDSGVIFKEADELAPLVLDKKAVPVTLGTEIVPEEFVTFVTTISEKGKELSGVSFVDFIVNETTFVLEGKTDQGFSVFFDTTRDPSRQLSALKVLLDAHRGEIKEYADLRVEGKAYLK